MASTTPQIKVETSPTGSLLSDPSGVYPSLFSGSTVASSAAATPTDTGAASAFLSVSGDDLDLSLLKGSSFQTNLSSLTEEGDDISDALLDASTTGGDADSASPDKKPTKKRKSWGQVLPEPKTNLPPRYVNVSPLPQTPPNANPSPNTGNGPKPKTKRNSAVSSVFCAIGELHSPQESGSVLRSRLWKSGTRSSRHNWQRFGEKTQYCTSA